MSIKQGVVTLVLGCGVVLFLLTTCRDLPILFRSWAIQVQHPASYEFAKYDKLLHDFVDADGLVDYSSLKKSGLLNLAVDELATISPDKFPTREARLCYWINAYNLLILKTICDNYPVTSIRLLGNKPSLTKYIVASDIYSVKDVLETRLAGNFGDEPLATFVVNGGAQGYPPLINHVIEPTHLKADEQANLYKFANDPRNSKYDDVTNRFSIAPYFQFYSDEYSVSFDSPHALVNSCMKKHINTGSVSMICDYLPHFNWMLNDKALGIVDPEGQKLKR